MTIATLKPFKGKFVCPRCGHHIGSTRRYDWIVIGLGILATAALLLMLVPLGITAWNACIDFLSKKDSHSIFYQPLEDWTPF